MVVKFSPPDVSELEIKYVSEALASGWITMGLKVKELERRIAEYCGVAKAVCLNSQTACAEMALHLLEIGPGDEVISGYTGPVMVYLGETSVDLPCRSNPGSGRYSTRLLRNGLRGFRKSHNTKDKSDNSR